MPVLIADNTKGVLTRWGLLYLLALAQGATLGASRNVLGFGV